MVESQSSVFNQREWPNELNYRRTRRVESALGDPRRVIPFQRTTVGVNSRATKRYEERACFDMTGATREEHKSSCNEIVELQVWRNDWSCCQIAVLIYAWSKNYDQVELPRVLVS